MSVKRRLPQFGRLAAEAVAAVAAVAEEEAEEQLEVEPELEAEPAEAAEVVQAVEAQAAAPEVAVVDPSVKAVPADLPSVPEMEDSESRSTSCRASLARPTAWLAVTISPASLVLWAPPAADRPAVHRAHREAKRQSVLTHFKFNGRECAAQCGNVFSITKKI